MSNKISNKYELKTLGLNFTCEIICKHAKDCLLSCSITKKVYKQFLRNTYQIKKMKNKYYITTFTGL